MEACSPQTLGRACGSALFPIMKEPHTDMLAIENGHKFIVHKISIFYWAMIGKISPSSCKSSKSSIYNFVRRHLVQSTCYLFPVHFPKAPGSPASVISPSASTCILANSEGQPSQVGKSTRRITHSPRFFGCDQSHNCPVHILTSPPGEGVLQRRIDT